MVDLDIVVKLAQLHPSVCEHSLISRIDVFVRCQYTYWRIREHTDEDQDSICFACNQPFVSIVYYTDWNGRWWIHPGTCWNCKRPLIRMVYYADDQNRWWIHP
jgi:hypothetical protein